MGDFNFHREAENASIPDGWRELPAVVDLGATWDYGKNAMLAHYLPLRNLYNGLGLGAHLGWPSPMRLDRVLVSGGGLGKPAWDRRHLLSSRARLHLNDRGRRTRGAHQLAQLLLPQLLALKALARSGSEAPAQAAGRERRQREGQASGQHEGVYRTDGDRSMHSFACNHTSPARPSALCKLSWE